MADDIYRLSHTAKQLDEAVTKVGEKVDISDFITSAELDEMWGNSSFDCAKNATVFAVSAGKSVFGNAEILEV